MSSTSLAVDPFIIRQRIYAALNVPPANVLFLHVWATLLEGRQCGHEMVAYLAGCPESSTGLRQAATRALDWYKLSGLNFGNIERRRRRLTVYSEHLPNRAVAWIQQQLSTAPDHNPITALDRFIPEAIQVFALATKPKDKEKKKRGAAVASYRERSCITGDTLAGRGKSALNRRKPTYKHGPLLKHGEQAIALARDGYQVFPCAWPLAGLCSCWRGRDCKAPAKHPFIIRWQQCATRYEGLIHDYWLRHALANIGIKTGTPLPGGLFLMALDVDLKTFGPGALARLIDEQGALPQTRRHLTPSGGYHDLFASPIPFQSKIGVLGCGLDIKCLGGFIVGPGSISLSGGEYLQANDLPIALLPVRWVDWIQRVWRKEIPSVQIGERHRALTEWCGAMIGKDGLSREAALHVLKHRRDTRCVVGPPRVMDEELESIVDYCIRSQHRQIASGRAA